MNRKTQPDLKLIDQLYLPAVEKSKLDNGIPLYSINAGNEDVVKLEFIFNAGKWQQQKKLAAYMTSRLMKQGTAKMTSREISDELDFYGASVKCENNADEIRFEITTLSKFVGPVFKLSSEILTEPSFPQHEMEIIVKNQKQRLMVNKKKVEYLARVKCMSSLFGQNHSYGSEPMEEDYDSFQLKDAISHYENFVHGGNCLVIASGKLPDGFHQSLQKYFGMKDWVKQPMNIENNKTIEANEGNHLINMDDASQSAIRIGKILFDKRHADYNGLRVLNVILGGYFGSRLMANVREDKGYTYGIYSSLQSFQHSGYMMIGTEVGTDVTEAAREEIYKEIQLLIDEPVKQEELQCVKNYLSGSMLSAFDGVFNVSAALSNLLPYGLDFDFVHLQFETVKNITADELQSLAIKYYQAESFTEVIAGAVNQEVKKS